MSSSPPPEPDAKEERTGIMEDEPGVVSDPAGGVLTETKDDGPNPATADEDHHIGNAMIQEDTEIDPDDEARVSNDLANTDTALETVEVGESHPGGSDSDVVVPQYVHPPSTGASSGPGFDVGLGSYSAQQFPGTYNEGGADGEERASSPEPHNGKGSAIDAMGRTGGENGRLETEEMGIVHNTKSARDEGFEHGGGAGAVDAAATRPTRFELSAAAGGGGDYQGEGRDGGGSGGGDGNSMGGKDFENNAREEEDNNFVGQGGGRRMFDGSRVAEPADDIRVVHAGEGADLIAGVDDLPVFANEQSKALNDEIKVREGVCG